MLPEEALGLCVMASQLTSSRNCTAGLPCHASSLSRSTSTCERSLHRCSHPIETRREGARNGSARRFAAKPLTSTRRVCEGRVASIHERFKGVLRDLQDSLGEIRR